MKKSIETFKKYHLLFFSVLLFITFLPLLILKGNLYVTIHDNLDSEIPYRVVLANSNNLFQYNSHIEQIMGGLPRSTITSGLNIVMLLYVLLSPLSAYITNSIIVRLISFIGMYLLLRDHILQEDNFITSGVAFIFAILPFYMIYGLCIAGLPILLYSILNIRKNEHKIISFIIVALFPLYSSLIYVGIFILCVLGIWFLIDLLMKRKVKHFGLAILLLFIVYSLVEHNLIICLLQSEEYVSHRILWNDFIVQQSTDFRESVTISVGNFILNQYHAASFQVFIVFIVTPISLIVNFFTRRNMKLLFLLLGITTVFSFLYGFENWNGWIPIKEKIGILNQIRIRFYWFNPLLWYMIFALAIQNIYKLNCKKIPILFPSIAMFFIVGQIILIGSTSPEILNNIAMLSQPDSSRTNQIVTYNKYFSEELFQEISKEIGHSQSSYRTISIGIVPGILQYNGFYTLDSYQNNYPLEYKEKFRKIIKKELDKNEEWKAYFDNWGSRCYIFPAELESYEITKDQSSPIHNLELNPIAIQDLSNGMDVYLFSTVEIENYMENELDYLGYYESENSPWGIFLYEFRS